jgi:hypothetical protein
MIDIVGNDPQVQLNTRIKLSEKTALMKLAQAKGAKDYKAFLRMLSIAKEVKITL